MEHKPKFTNMRGFCLLPISSEPVSTCTMLQGGASATIGHKVARGCFMNFRAVTLLFSIMILASLILGAEAKGERKGAVPGGFDFYVLSLSWSPSFCRSAGADRSPEQCKKGSGKGFVLHGLWPQDEDGYPSSCTPAEQTLSKYDLEAGAGLYPEQWLVKYQWRRHGTCSGEAPEQYFRMVKTAFERIRIPDGFKSVDSNRVDVPAEIEKQFSDANPGLTSDMISVSCRDKLMQDVRICFSRDLSQFRTCPQVDRAGCKAPSVTVPPLN